ncbi:hypothetical protein WEU38_11015 [Cyanobacterium aponinum AL20118]|uniref:Uncharacterized protein n=1 Tax=Cyanobacterium aponinum AL20115 TaxID=3090662 RepID=A0AAF0ZCB3_9CHRO|nr:hypothetical protein [Cyanobacterium aponinum]WPF87342.1 hypothetical protein SAY89_11045 [Cyanobacterium aponinum AL20115]
MLHITIGIQELLEDNRHLALIIKHIAEAITTETIINDELLRDFQVWTVKDNYLYCQADKDEPQLFKMRTLFIPNLKFYCCFNGIGYTLMLPEEY